MKLKQNSLKLFQSCFEKKLFCFSFMSMRGEFNVKTDWFCTLASRLTVFAKSRPTMHFAGTAKNLIA